MNEPNDNMSFLDHLEALRWHLIRVCFAVLFIGVFAFIFKDFIFDYIILAPKQGDFPTYKFFCYIGKVLGIDSDFCKTELPFILQNRTMAGQFSAAIWTAIWAGIILGFPYLIYQGWCFISPGLYAHERKIASRFIGISSFLFFLGVGFGYFLIAPLSINFLANYSVSQSIVNQIDLDSYIAIIRSSVLSCGLIFELPIIIYFLAKIGLITPDILRKYRKVAIVLTLFIAAIITPPDISSQVIVSIPILILYEVSIFICSWVIKKENH